MTLRGEVFPGFPYLVQCLLRTEPIFFVLPAEADELAETSRQDRVDYLLIDTLITVHVLRLMC